MRIENFNKILILIFAIATIVSCQKKDEYATNNDEVVVKFSSVTETRAVDNTWSYGDAVGIYMFDSSTKNELKSNVLYTVSLMNSDQTEVAFTATLEDQLMYPDEGYVDFLAYYPYKDNISSNLYPINTTDQTSSDLLNDLDFMLSDRVEDRSKSDDNAVSLSFSHKMSNVQFNVTRKSDVLDKEIYMTIVNVKNNAAYDITDSSVGFTNIDDDVSNTQIAVIDDVAQAIIIPQELVNSSITILIDGTVHSIVRSFNGTFEEGKRYTYNMTIGQDEFQIEGASITDWIGKEDAATEMNPTIDDKY